MWASQVALVVKNWPANAGDIRNTGSIGVRKIPWMKAWLPTPLFCMENSMDGGAWQATIHRVTKSWTRLKRLSTHTKGT